MHAKSQTREQNRLNWLLKHSTPIPEFELKKAIEEFKKSSNYQKMSIGILGCPINPEEFLRKSDGYLLCFHEYDDSRTLFQVITYWIHGVSKKHPRYMQLLKPSRGGKEIKARFFYKDLKEAPLHLSFFMLSIQLSLSNAAWVNACYQADLELLPHWLALYFIAEPERFIPAFKYYLNFGKRNPETARIFKEQMKKLFAIRAKLNLLKNEDFVIAENVKETRRNLEPNFSIFDGFEPFTFDFRTLEEGSEILLDVASLIDSSEHEMSFYDGEIDLNVEEALERQDKMFREAKIIINEDEEFKNEAKKIAANPAIVKVSSQHSKTKIKTTTYDCLLAHEQEISNEMEKSTTLPKRDEFLQIANTSDLEDQEILRQLIQSLNSREAESERCQREAANSKRVLPLTFLKKPDPRVDY